MIDIKKLLRKYYGMNSLWLYLQDGLATEDSKELSYSISLSYNLLTGCAAEISEVNSPFNALGMMNASAFQLNKLFSLFNLFITESAFSMMNTLMSICFPIIAKTIKVGMLIKRFHIHSVFFFLKAFFPFPLFELFFHFFHSNPVLLLLVHFLCFWITSFNLILIEIRLEIFEE